MRVRVTAQPEKGKANKAVTALLAKALRLPKSSFAVIAGETARDKTIRVDGGDLHEAIAELGRAHGG